MSRCLVVDLGPLDEAELVAVMRRALAHRRGFGGSGLEVTPQALATLARLAEGDARRALGSLEAIAEPVLAQARGERPGAVVVDQSVLAAHVTARGPRYDRDGDEHYQVVSAFIKSMRGSDPDAAVYWLARMLQAGEEPRFVCRRMIVFAAEDVGNADPQALVLATATMQAHELVGMPEARLAMAQLATYLACAPKSKASYDALGAANELVAEFGALPVPLSLRNAPTALAKHLGWSEGYVDPHQAGGWSPAHHLPDRLRDVQLYHPTRNGHEAKLSDRLTLWRRLRDERFGSEQSEESRRANSKAARVESRDPDVT